MFLDIIICVSSDILLRRLESVIQSSGCTQVLHGYPGKIRGELPGFLRLLYSPACEELCTKYQGMLECNGLHYINDHLPLLCLHPQRLGWLLPSSVPVSITF